LTEDEDRRARIQAKIAASQARLHRDGPPSPTRLPDDTPPERLTSLLAEYPGLTIAAGLGLGLLAGALLPRSAGSKLARRGTALAAVAGEIGLILARQAIEKAGEAGREGRDAAGRIGTAAGRKAGAARTAGTALAKKAIELAVNARR
jgi:hypothetical protein